MKIKLEISDRDYDEVSRFLLEKGIELDDEAEFILTQKSCYIDRLAVRDEKTGERALIPVQEIIYAESFGHTVTAHTNEREWLTSDRLYQLCSVLDPEKFLRISVSTIIAVDKVKRIMPTLSRKFIITLSNGGTVEVTRSYYNIFKEFFGI